MTGSDQSVPLAVFDDALRTGRLGGVTGEVLFYPGHHQVSQAIELLIAEFSATRNVMPFLDAPSAACGCGMLRGKHGMSPERRLPAVLCGPGIAHTSSKQLARMSLYGCTPFAPRISPIACTQGKTGSERRSRQTNQRLRNPRIPAITLCLHSLQLRFNSDAPTHPNRIQV
jgi:hypothetical protein